jgi:hypothetical protein
MFKIERKIKKEMIRHCRLIITMRKRREVQKEFNNIPCFTL